MVAGFYDLETIDMSLLDQSYSCHENLRALASLELAQISCARMVGLVGWVGLGGSNFEINDRSALAEPINRMNEI